MKTMEKMPKEMGWIRVSALFITLAFGAIMVIGAMGLDKIFGKGDKTMKRV